MKKVTIRNKIDTNNKINRSYFWLLFIAILFLTIGYAAVTSSISLTGSASALKYGDVFIESISVSETNNAVQNTIPSYSGTTESSNITMGNDAYSYITYEVVIANGSDNIKKYNGISYSGNSAINYEVTYDETSADYLLPGSSATYYLTYKYRSGAQPSTYDVQSTFNFQDMGKFYAVSYTSSVDLRNSDSAPVIIKAMNNDNKTINYSLSIDNNKFELSDASGNTTFSIPAHSEKELTLYLKKKTSQIYYKTSYTTGFKLTYDSKIIDFGQIDIITSATPGYEDNTPPQIGPITLTMSDTVGTFTANWSSLDSGTCAPVVNYVLKLYNSSGNLISTQTVSGSTTSYTYTSQVEDTYYLVIYGIDEAENSGESAATSATTTTTDARKSDSVEMRWTYTVTYNLTGCTSSGPTTVTKGSTLETTVTKSNSNYTFKSMTVTMGGTELDSSAYTKNTSTGAISVPNVQGDLVITVTASSGLCLLKGTKVTLFDGTKKNIENIDYDDLLLVYDHQIGKFVGEYPIWIEKEHTGICYTKITFSDGETLNVSGEHCVFSVDSNRYVDVQDRNNFNIGTKIIKVTETKNGYKTKIVKVTNIQEIQENIQYYHVVSTRYYNIIADNCLTTDGRDELSNYFEFKDNLTWTNRREYALDNNIQIDYSNFNFIPYYLFKGLKAQDGAVIITYGYMTEKEFKEVFTSMLINSSYAKDTIKDKTGNNLWMVTTTDDVVINKDKYKVKEGTIYTLKEPKNKEVFIGWYNAAEGKMYNAGDSIAIYTGTHFIAMYK